MEEDRLFEFPGEGGVEEQQTHLGEDEEPRLGEKTDEGQKLPGKDKGRI